MFDISWSEFLLIGVVALIVIGPKELPAVMRTLGQWTRKVRSMASDFQNQFHEAMREAEMADLKKEVDDLAHDVRNLDPLKDVREHVESTGEVVKQSLASTSEPAPALPDAAAEAAGKTEAPAETPSASFEAAAAPAAEAPAGTAAAPRSVDTGAASAEATAVAAPVEPPAREMETIGAGVPAAAPDSSGEAGQGDGTGRSG